jgi:hypothetical protein
MQEEEAAAARVRETDREFFKGSKIWCNRGERRWIRDSREEP